MADKYVKTSEVADKYFDGKGKEGSYQESTGGGHPFDKGDSNTRTTRANGKLRQAENNTDQPRTDDGKFTYSSTNGGKAKYGGRGKTVPPTLTGGENGVYLKDVYDKEGNLIHEESAKDFYADKDYIPFRAGDKVAFEGKVRTLVVDQFKIAQGYDEAAKVLESKTTKEFMEQATKSRGAGRYSKAEKRAAEESIEKKNEGKAFGVKGEKPGEHAKSEKYLAEEKEKEEKAAKEKEEKKEFREKYSEPKKEKDEVVEEKEFTLDDLSDDNLADKENQITEKFKTIEEWYDWSDEHEDQVDDLMEKLSQVWDIDVSDAYDRVENKIRKGENK